MRVGGGAGGIEKLRCICMQIVRDLAACDCKYLSQYVQPMHNSCEPYSIYGSVWKLHGEATGKASAVMQDTEKLGFNDHYSCLVFFVSLFSFFLTIQWSYIFHFNELLFENSDPVDSRKIAPCRGDSPVGPCALAEFLAQILGIH